MEKLIITIAPTGNVPTKELNPHSPLTVKEIIEDVKRCQAAGASIAHLHVRDKNARPTSDKEIFRQLLDGIYKENINIITQVSTGARGGENTTEYRGQMLDLKTEMASLSTGSSNFPTSINGNSPDLIEALANKMLQNNIKPEIEVFDVAMIDNALKLVKKGILKDKLHFNLVMNVPGSIKGTPKNLMFLIDSLPKNSTFSISGIGWSQVNMAAISIMMGGHVRTGLEDVIHYDRNTLATNEMLVNRIVRLAKEFGREIATTEEARQILAL